MSRIYIAAEEMDLIFKKSEVEEVIKMYCTKNIWEIAEKLDRDPDEVAVLIIDLAKRDKLDFSKKAHQV